MNLGQFLMNRMAEEDKAEKLDKDLLAKCEAHAEKTEQELKQAVANRSEAEKQEAKNR
jgi:hypothetical protein